MHRRRIFVALLSVVGLAGVACGGEPESITGNQVALPVLGCTLAVNSTPADTPAARSSPDATQGRIVWSVRTPGHVNSRLYQAPFTVDDDVVFVVAGSDVLKLGLSDGVEVWRQPSVDGTRPEVVGTGPLIAVASTSARDEIEYMTYRMVITGRSPGTGAERWTTGVVSALPHQIVSLSSAVVAHVVTGTDARNVIWSSDAATGESNWRDDALLAGAGPDAAVLYRKDDCAIHLVDAATGQVRWSAPTPARVKRDDVVSADVRDDVMYVLHQSYTKRVSVGRIDVVSGEASWWVRLPNASVNGDMTVADSSVFVSARGKTSDAVEVYAIDARHGTVSWSSEMVLKNSGRGGFGGTLEMSIVAADDVLNVTNGSELLVIARQDGTIRRVVDLERTLALIVDTVDAAPSMTVRATERGALVAAEDNVAMIE